MKKIFYSFFTLIFLQTLPVACQPGKAGFQKRLRNEGRKITRRARKDKNFDACRMLHDGRLVRDVKNEQLLKEWEENAEKRAQEKEEKEKQEQKKEEEKIQQFINVVKKELDKDGQLLAQMVEQALKAKKKTKKKNRKKKRKKKKFDDMLNMSN